MAGARYYVSKHADSFKVRYDDKDYAYETQSAALLAAIKAATEASLRGHAAEVLIQGPDGKWRTEWPTG